jgi:hypothetical protein
VEGGAVLKLILPEFKVRPPSRSTAPDLHGLAHPPQVQPPASL